MNNFTLENQKISIYGFFNSVGDGEDKKIKIPELQRPYEWGVEQCEEFLDDLLNNFHIQEDYYLGNIVSYVDNNDTYIIDGQQRITTISILAKIVIDILENVNIQQDDNITRLLNEYKVIIKSHQAGFNIIFFDLLLQIESSIDIKKEIFYNLLNNITIDNDDENLKKNNYF